MAKRYTKIISEYCTARGIEIPGAFGRHSASPYAIIRTDTTPPKLVARTWFKVADVIYYLEHILQPELKVAPEALPIQIVNFKEGVFKHWQGGSILKDGEELPCPTNAVQPTAIRADRATGGGVEG